MRPAREGRENIVDRGDVVLVPNASMRPAREGRENGVDTNRFGSIASLQ